MSERLIKVRVNAGAKTEKVEELSHGVYKVRTTAVPERGQANQRVTGLLAEHLGLHRTQVHLVSGHTSRDKVFSVLSS